jgi:hypothetical protein
MCDAGRFDDTNVRKSVFGAYVLEEPRAGAKKNRHQMNMYLLNKSRLEELLRSIRGADRDVLRARGGPSLP